MPEDLVANLVKSTAFLRREFLGRENYPDDEKRTLYFFDTDIVTAYCAPWIKGPGRDQGGNGYGEPILFPDPEIETQKIDSIRRKRKAQNISSILAQYACSLTKGRPVFQFKPQFDETTDVYRIVREKASDKADVSERARNDRIRRKLIAVSAIIASKQSDGAGKDEIGNLVDHLTQILNQSQFSGASGQLSAVHEWDNFVELNVQRGGIYPISHANRFLEREGEEALAQAVQGFDDGQFMGEEKEDFEILNSYWRNLLPRHYSAMRDSERIDKDAKSFSLLALLNLRLHKLGWKAVFVTGSKNLVDASFSASKIGGNSRLNVILDQFSHKYVRHLWAYTNEALIEPHNKKRFVNWLDGLLAEWAGTSEFQEEQLSKLLSQKNFRHISVVECRKSYKKWNEMTRFMASENQFINLGSENSDLKEKLLKRIELARREHISWAQLVNLLIEENDRKKDASFLVFSNVGAEALIAARQASRHPPDLDFESLTNTNEIFTRLTKVDGYKNRREFEVDFARILDDCYPPNKDNRQFCHLQYLALGAAFASASRWSVALSQAQRAIKIIERSKDLGMPIPVRKDSNSHMSGREAYFLAAVSLRMIAKKEKDFDGSAKFLENAQRALASDRKKETAKNFDPLRFYNEECAQSLARYYFLRMQNPDDMQSQRFSKVVRDLEVLLKDVGFFLASKKLLKRRAATLSHVALNTLQARAIHEFRRAHDGFQEDSFPVTDRVLKDALNLLDALAPDSQDAVLTTTKNNVRLFSTKLMQTYRVVARIILDKDQEISMKDLDRAFEGWKSSVVTGYDEWRFENLYKLGKELLLERGM